MCWAYDLFRAVSSYKWYKQLIKTPKPPEGPVLKNIKIKIKIKQKSQQIFKNKNTLLFI